MLDLAEFTPQGLFRNARMKALGLVNVEWKESPFEWVKVKYYQVKRNIHRVQFEALLGALSSSGHNSSDGTRGYDCSSDWGIYPCSCTWTYRDTNLRSTFNEAYLDLFE